MNVVVSIQNMVPATVQPPSRTIGTHLVLYDGVCGLCNGLSQFLLRHDRRRVFVFASLQSAVGRAVVERNGGDPDVLTSFYVVADYDTQGARFFAKGDAALFVASQLGWPWRAALAARLLPKPVRKYAVQPRGPNSLSRLRALRPVSASVAGAPEQAHRIAGAYDNARVAEVIRHRSNEPPCSSVHSAIVRSALPTWPVTVI